MKNCHILLSESFTYTSLFEKILERKFNLQKVSIKELIRNSLSDLSDNYLSKNVKSFIQSGELIPTELITKILINQIASIQKGILIIDYPKTKEQYLHLEKSLDQQNIQIEKLWILQLNNIDKILSEERDEKIRIRITERFELLKIRNKKIEEIVNKNTTVIKINFDYYKNWNEEEIEKLISNNL